MTIADDIETVLRGINPRGVYSVDGISVERLAEEALYRIVAELTKAEVRADLPNPMNRSYVV